MLFVQLNNSYAQLFTKTFMFGLLTASLFVFERVLCSLQSAFVFSKYLSWLLKHTEIFLKAFVKEEKAGTALYI